MLEDLKSFYAKMFTYRGEAVAREVYNPLVVSVAVGIFFAIGNSFASGYVTKWIVGVATVVWGVATLLSLWAIGVRRVTWLRRPVAVLVIAALCAVCGLSLWFYGFGVPSLLGGVLRPFWGYLGVVVLAVGVVVWLAWVLPSAGAQGARSGRRAGHKPSGKPSGKPSRAKTSKHGAPKETNKGKHLNNHAPRSIASNGAASQSAGQSEDGLVESTKGSAPVHSGTSQGINNGVLTL